MPWSGPFSRCVSGTNDSGFQFFKNARDQAWVIFYLNRLGWNAGDYVLRRDVSCDHCIAADHGIIFDLHTGQNRSVISHSHAVAESSHWRVDLMDVVNVVTV